MTSSRPSRAVVAGQHDDPHALRAQAAHRFGGRRLDRIGHAEQARELSVDGEEHHRLRLGAHAVGDRGERLGAHAELVEKRLIAERDLASSHFADDASTRARREVLQLRGREPLRLRAAHDRRGERMLARALERRRQAQDLVFGPTARRDDADELRLALGQRAGLVDDDRVDRAK
jgi:hypothetical protein